MTASPGCTPGSTDEQLPAHMLDLLQVGCSMTYLSTACEAAQQLTYAQASIVAHDTHITIISQQAGVWSETMHNRCRLTNKFTGVPCSCSCHHPGVS